MNKNTHPADRITVMLDKRLTKRLRQDIAKKLNSNPDESAPSFSAVVNQRLAQAFKINLEDDKP